MNTMPNDLLLPALVFAVYALGVWSAFSAILSSRNSQSAIAWALSCVMFPYVAVPLYALFGRNRFRHYVLARRSNSAKARSVVEPLLDHAVSCEALPERYHVSCRVFEQLASMPFTGGNSVELLPDGEATFEIMCEQIKQAQECVLVQFYIVRADPLGMRMARLLKQKVAEGVRVLFLYDALGSYNLPRRYVEDLRRAGVEIYPFKAGRGWRNRLQINFRNHRKMVVTDGRWAVTGGANLGDEYRGRGPRGYWRDTMVAVAGRAAQEMQLSFAEDWLFITGHMPELNWDPRPSADGRSPVLVLPTGPADEQPTCSMMFSQAIHSAEKRLWITTAYFVPDKETVRALQMAALRGVDVRILLPDKANHLLVHWAGLTFLDELERSGVQCWRYTKGVFHEKVVLVDDHLSLIGSANTDNRSFYLNFECILLVADAAFAARTKAMLEEDFANSCSSSHEAFAGRGILFRLVARLSRLLAPIL